MRRGPTARAVVVLVVAIAAACGSGRPKVPDAAACPADAKPANLNFTLKDTSGKEVRLADYKGKVVLLDKFENAKPFAVAMKMNYPVLDGDPQQDKIDDAYGPLFGLPMSFIISRDGRVCQKHLGLPGATKDKDPDA